MVGGNKGKAVSCISVQIVNIGHSKEKRTNGTIVRTAESKWMVLSMSKTDIIEDLVKEINALLKEAREYGRCNTCKYYKSADDTCHAPRRCDGKIEWLWRGIK